jgi:hypothetical protein
MALYHGGLPHLLAFVNQQTTVPLAFEGLLFSPVAAGEPDRIRVTALPDYEYRGTQVISYQRLDLNELPQRLLVSPRCHLEGETLYAVLPTLQRHLGIGLTVDDVEDTPVTYEGEFANVTLRAKPTSQGFTGECALAVLQPPELSTLLTFTTIQW